MEGNQAGSSLDTLIARNMYPASSIPALSSMELQVQSIKDRLREETEAIPKAKEELNSLSADMASYAEANAHLIAASKQKLAETLWEKALFNFTSVRGNSVILNQFPASSHKPPSTIEGLLVLETQ